MTLEIILIIACVVGCAILEVLKARCAEREAREECQEIKDSISALKAEIASWKE